MINDPYKSTGKAKIIPSLCVSVFKTQEAAPYVTQKILPFYSSVAVATLTIISKLQQLMLNMNI